MNIDFALIAKAGETLITAAGTHPIGALIIVVGMLGGWAIHVWSKK